MGNLGLLRGLRELRCGRLWSLRRVRASPDGRGRPSLLDQKLSHGDLSRAIWLDSRDWRPWLFNVKFFFLLLSCYFYLVTSILLLLTVFRWKRILEGLAE